MALAFIIIDTDSLSISMGLAHILKQIYFIAAFAIKGCLSSTRRVVSTPTSKAWLNSTIPFLACHLLRPFQAILTPLSLHKGGGQIVAILQWSVKRTVVTKAPLRVQFLPTFGGEEQEASAFLSKKRGREGSIESQQKFDFFSYDFTKTKTKSRLNKTSNVT